MCCFTAFENHTEAKKERKRNILEELLFNDFVGNRFFPTPTSSRTQMTKHSSNKSIILSYL